MKIKNDKPVLVIIVILLIVFVPLTLYGYFLVDGDDVSVDPNPDKEFYVDGKLHFYEGDVLLGTYPCVSDTCNYASSSNEEYLEYYYTGNISNIPLNGDFVFIKDDNEIILYDIKNNLEIDVYEEIKSYNAVNSNNLLFVKKDGLWGAISLDNYEIVIDIIYDYIGLSDNVEDEIINSDNILVKKDNMYYLVAQNGEELSSKFTTDIIRYTDRYIFTKNNLINMTNYSNVNYVSSIRDMIIEGNYAGLFVNDMLYVVDLDENISSSTFLNSSLASINVPDGGVVNIILEGTLNVYINNELVEEIII